MYGRRLRCDELSWCQLSALICIAMHYFTSPLLDCSTIEKEEVVRKIHGAFILLSALQLVVYSVKHPEPPVAAIEYPSRILAQPRFCGDAITVMYMTSARTWWIPAGIKHFCVKIHGCLIFATANEILQLQKTVTCCCQRCYSIWRHLRNTTAKATGGTTRWAPRSAWHAPEVGQRGCINVVVG